MKTAGRALRLSIFVGESDGWRHRSLYTEIVHRAHKAGLAGATAIRGIEGFGASSVDSKRCGSPQQSAHHDHARAGLQTHGAHPWQAKHGSSCQTASPTHSVEHED
ncbi:DUF190 domain-containing protein [Lentzea atacamensis]|uniref:DUF190 domain-containing protein n=1 Tax=Lentzea atacamensis TaxID=531938 RepID=UPI000D6A9078|nr:DUF190 domain-containing protein [Lentzea atacamensis]